MDERAASHRFVEHTSEVRLEVSAKDGEALFAEASRGLAELMLGAVPEPPASAQPRAVEVHAHDLAALLVEWLNELIYLSEAHKEVFTRVRMEQVDATTARGVVSGVSPEALKTAVKAATWHEASVVPGEPWRASVVFDV